MANQDRDQRLGMHMPIERRDLLQGALLGAGLLALSGCGAASNGNKFAAAEPQNQPGYYPPERTGMRGSHPGSFENAHALRDGTLTPEDAEKTGEDYDLVVVGGGLSGLAAAFFLRAERPDARILILDNHDDFGGHAKRNEFVIGGRMQLMNGGTMGIESATPYSEVADGVLQALGVHPEELSKASDQDDFYAGLGLGSGTFFDKETFGADQFVRSPARARGQGVGREAMQAFLAAAPLSPAVRASILDIETGDSDYLPGRTSDQKKDHLSRLSYQDFLLKDAKADPGIVPYYLHRTDGLWGCGIDGVSALDCWGSGLPGFQGLKLEPGATPRMGYTPGNYMRTGGSYHFHFPDGNASVARLLVRDLIPAAIPGSGAESIVLARCDYSQLDKPGQNVRIRLSAPVVRARNLGTDRNSGVEIHYRRNGRTWRVRGRQCVLACWNMMIPYLCPEMPDAQKAALHYLVKTPLVYTTVALNNWRAFDRLKVSRVSAPGGYHSSFGLNQAQRIGGYESVGTPDQPMLVHMTRTPASPGLPEREQHKIGRFDLLETPFSTFEQHIRSDMARALAGGGFDPARDIAAITVNRWPHGYAPEYNSLIDPDSGLPIVAARARFGAITIANADSGGGAYTDVAIDMANRAVNELLA